MLNIDDTICAVSSPAAAIGSAARHIIRVCGPDTYAAVDKLLSEPVLIQKNTIVNCSLRIDDELKVGAKLYCFFAPNSYTGQHLCEIHLEACPAVVEVLLRNFYDVVRPAEPGEFTKRAYLNGKLDLTQAEAVCDIVSSANTAQLSAAQRLLEGSFSSKISNLRSRMLDLLGRIEAGLDFSEEPIEFVSKTEAGQLVSGFSMQISDILAGSIRCERIIDLDSVGLAGVPNAGKSSLLNALLGQRRSIVSQQEATTRDVLTGIMELSKMDCVIFDCAGLLPEDRQADIINRLSHNASLEALNGAALVLFCVDIAKRDVTADLRMRKQITCPNVIYVATKADKLVEDEPFERQDFLKNQFGAEFILTSTKTRHGMSDLKAKIEERLLMLRSADTEHQDRLTINQRHRRRLDEAVKALADCAEEIAADSLEVAAMLLRQSYEILGGLERENIDEAVLDRIFSRFCIGK